MRRGAVAIVEVPSCGRGSRLRREIHQRGRKEVEMGSGKSENVWIWANQRCSSVLGSLCAHVNCLGEEFNARSGGRWDPDYTERTGEKGRFAIIVFNYWVTRYSPSIWACEKLRVDACYFTRFSIISVNVSMWAYLYKHGYGKALVMWLRWHFTCEAPPPGPLFRVQ